MSLLMKFKSSSCNSCVQYLGICFNFLKNETHKVTCFSLFFLGEDFQEIKLDSDFSTKKDSEPNDDVLLDLGASSSSSGNFPWPFW